MNSIGISNGQGLQGPLFQDPGSSGYAHDILAVAEYIIGTRFDAPNASVTNAPITSSPEKPTAEKQ